MAQVKILHADWLHNKPKLERPISHRFLSEAGGAVAEPTAKPLPVAHLSLRTSDFQSEKTGSTPVGSANDIKDIVHYNLLQMGFVSQSCPSREWAR